MTHCILKSKLWLALVAAVALTPAAFAEEGNAANQVNGERLALADAAREAARDWRVPVEKRIAPVLKLLNEELRNPSHGDLGSGSPYTISESVQSRLLEALGELGDSNPLAAAAKQAPFESTLSKYLIIAMGRAMTPKDNPDHARAVAEALCKLMRQDPRDFTRSKAARALGSVAVAQPALEAEIATALQAVLADQSTRTMQNDSGSPKPGKVQLVYAEAASSLLHLGFKVNGTRVEREDPDARQARLKPRKAVEQPEEIKDANGVAWVTAKYALMHRGYAITWTTLDRTLEALRDGTTVRLWIGCDIALVGKKPVRMEQAPRLEAGNMLVPVSFVEAVSK